jgi:N-acetylglutamate synthase-like GNAT family acetyltransferase
MPAKGEPINSTHQMRLATIEDLEEIEAVILAAYENHMRQMVFPPVQLLRDHSQAIEAGEVWATGDPIVGAITLIEMDDTLLIENLVVHPTVQGSGLGRTLMAFAERTAELHGLQRVALHHNQVNIAHSGFFGHLGYHTVDRRTQHGSRRALMEKRVAAAAPRA